ncbi:hypothetical protein D8I24_3232 (plasmid) [Cupriavidus necator H850]|nr:hypothetical protein D8I24_3232 [Cupriavidus necator H850]
MKTTDTASQTPCNCPACPGAGCDYGCQKPAEQDACARRPQCQCGPECACQKR